MDNYFLLFLKISQGRYHVSVDGSALFVLVRVVTKTGEQARDFNYPGLTVLDGYKWNNNDPTTLDYEKNCIYSCSIFLFVIIFSVSSKKDG